MLVMSKLNEYLKKFCRIKSTPEIVKLLELGRVGEAIRGSREFGLVVCRVGDKVKVTSRVGDVHHVDKELGNEVIKCVKSGGRVELIAHSHPPSVAIPSSGDIEILAEMFRLGILDKVENWCVVRLSRDRKLVGVCIKPSRFRELEEIYALQVPLVDLMKLVDVKPIALIGGDKSGGKVPVFTDSSARELEKKWVEYAKATLRDLGVGEDVVEEVELSC